MKENIKKLWDYINDAFDKEELDDAIEEFEFESSQMDDAILNEMSDGELRTLFFDMGYMVVNGLFYGDFDTYNEVLVYSLEFNEETVDFLNY